jgi:hypothetical protein
MSGNIMTYQTEWLIEGAVYQVEASGQLEMEDITQINDNMLTALDATTHTSVYIIADASKLERVGSGKLVQLKSVLSVLRHRKLAYFIILGTSQNPMIQFIQQILLTTMGVNFKRVDSLHDALFFIHELNPSLQPYEITETDGTSPD